MTDIAIDRRKASTYQASSFPVSRAETIFLSNARYFMIILVTIYHASLCFGTNTSWWYIGNNTKISWLDQINILGETFRMPVLFFIAGYLALPSLKRRGELSFMSDKLKRMGYPLLFGSIFIISVLHYFWNFSAPAGTAEVKEMGFFQYWLLVNIDALKLRAALWSDMNTFSQGHFWFIGVLIMFFSALAGLWRNKAFQSYFRVNVVVNQQTIVAIITMTLLFNFFASSMICSFVPESSWFSVIPFLEFMPARFPFFLSFFVVGVIASHQTWFTRSRIPGSYLFWFSFTAVFGYLLVSQGQSYYKLSDPSVMERSIFIFLRSCTSLGFLFLLLTAAQRFWNTQSGLGKMLADNSYYIYLAHYPICIALQYIFVMHSDLSAEFKWILISTITIILSTIIAKYLVKPYPKWTLTLLIASNVGMMVFIP